MATRRGPRATVASGSARDGEADVGRRQVPVRPVLPGVDAADGVEIGEAPLAMWLDCRTLPGLVPRLDEDEPTPAGDRMAIGEDTRPPQHVLELRGVAARADKGLVPVPGARVPAGLGDGRVVDEALGGDAVPDLLVAVHHRRVRSGEHGGVLAHARPGIVVAGTRVVALADEGLEARVLPR